MGVDEKELSTTLHSVPVDEGGGRWVWLLGFVAQTREPHNALNDNAPQGVSDYFQKIGLWPAPRLIEIVVVKRVNQASRGAHAHERKWRAVAGDAAQQVLVDRVYRVPRVPPL